MSKKPTIKDYLLSKQGIYEDSKGDIFADRTGDKFRYRFNIAGNTDRSISNAPLGGDYSVAVSLPGVGPPCYEEIVETQIGNLATIKLMSHIAGKYRDKLDFGCSFHAIRSRGSDEKTINMLVDAVREYDEKSTSDAFKKIKKGLLNSLEKGLRDLFK